MGAIYVVKPTGGTCDTGTTEISLPDCMQCGCQSSTPKCSFSGAYYGVTGCTDAPVNIAGDSPGGCINTANKNTPVFVKATVATDCGNVVEPDPTIVCQPADVPAECGATGLCIPQSEPGCILIDKGASCPTNYASSTEVYQGGSCGCTCGASEECPAEVKVYSDDGSTECTADEFTVNADDTCQMVVTTASQVRAAKAPDVPVGSMCLGTPNLAGGTEKTLCCPM